MGDYSLFDFLHGYIYARWPYLYIGIGTGEHSLTPIFKMFSSLYSALFGNDDPREIKFEDTYHGKVVLPDQAAQLVSVQEDISLLDLEPIIPYAKARDIIMRNPDHIVVLDCPCRNGRENPCLPLDVCLIIGEPFAGFVLKHHPRRSRPITRGEALEILRAEHDRGHVHHAFFKDAMLGRFYAICNCCSCCCGAMQAQRNGTMMLTASGYVCLVDDSLCEGCGTCQDSCPFEAITLPNGAAVVDPQSCMGCGVCVSRCDAHALSLEKSPAKGVPLELSELMEEALSPGMGPRFS